MEHLELHFNISLLFNSFDLSEVSKPRFFLSTSVHHIFTYFFFAFRNMKILQIIARQANRMLPVSIDKEATVLPNQAEP